MHVFKNILLRLLEVVLLVPAFGLLIPPVPSEEKHVYHLFPSLLFAVILFILSQSLSIYRDRQLWWMAILKVLLFIVFGWLVFERVTMGEM